MNVYRLGSTCIDWFQNPRQLVSRLGLGHLRGFSEQPRPIHALSVRAVFPPLTEPVTAIPRFLYMTVLKPFTHSLLPRSYASTALFSESMETITRFASTARFHASKLDP